MSFHLFRLWHTILISLESPSLAVFDGMVLQLIWYGVSIWWLRLREHLFTLSSCQHTSCAHHDTLNNEVWLNKWYVVSYSSLKLFDDGLFYWYSCISIRLRLIHFATHWTRYKITDYDVPQFLCNTWFSNTLTSRIRCLEQDDYYRLSFAVYALLYTTNKPTIDKLKEYK